MCVIIIVEMRRLRITDKSYKPKVPSQKDTAALCLEIVISEYEYERTRNQKLEAKIGITLAFCGLLAPYMLKYLNWSSMNSFFTLNNNQFFFILRIVVFLWWLVIVILYFLTVWSLIKVLTPIPLDFFNPKVIHSRRILSKEKDEAAQELMKSFEKLLERNTKSNNEQAQKYKQAVCYLNSCFILVFIYELIENFCKAFYF